jgi:hypothetical protein
MEEGLLASTNAGAPSKFSAATTPFCLTSFATSAYQAGKTSPEVLRWVHCTELPRAWLASHNISSPVKHDTFKPQLPNKSRKASNDSVCGTGLVNHDAIAEDIERFIEQLASKAAQVPTVPAAGL